MQDYIGTLEQLSLCLSDRLFDKRCWFDMKTNLSFTVRERYIFIIIPITAITCHLSKTLFCVIYRRNAVRTNHRHYHLDSISRVCLYEIMKASKIAASDNDNFDN